MDADNANAWQFLGVPARLRWLGGFRAAVARDADHLAALITAEVHKPADEALSGDILPLLAACAWLQRRGRRLLADQPLTGRPLWLLGQRAAVARAPLGTVAIIATWNYPVQLLGIQLIQALVAGNRVVVKPSEHAPRTQQRLLDLAVAAGLPPGTLTWTAASREAGRQLLDGSTGTRLDHVVFTGSTTVGREIAAWGARTLTPTTLELSGHDSAIVLADADPALAARTIWNAVLMNAGQTCMAPRRALVSAPVYRAFLDALAPLAAAARPARLITADAAARAGHLFDEALRAGARNLAGTREPPAAGQPWFRPAALVDCPPDALLVAGEHFSPLLAVVPVASDADALATHARFTHKLATSVFTRRAGTRAAAALARQLGSALVTFNDAVVPAMHPAASIAGIGASGWGVSRGGQGLLAMTRPVFITRTRPRFRLPIGPLPTQALAGLKRMTAFLYARGPAVTLPPIQPPTASPNAAAPDPVVVTGLAPPTPHHPPRDSAAASHHSHARATP